jgi:hypothetical protein
MRNKEIMKKLQFKRRKNAKTAIPSRITNETVAEHREKILAGGRRFKYPMQYARHRLVLVTILLTVAAFILVVALGWWQLYLAQNTSTFFYRTTRILPLPVANVDGQSVRYSNYLMYYNSSAHYLKQSEQVNFQTPDGKRQNDYIKRKSMDIAISNAYAAKLAHDLHISVSDDRVNQVTDAARNTSTGRISQETYDASALAILGWSPDEYRQDTKSKLLQQDVSFAIDTKAKQTETKALELLKDPNADLDKVAATLGSEGKAKVTTAVSGMVPLMNQDGGLSAAAAKLEKGQISGVIRTTAGDGYYFVKVIDKTATEVNYAYLRIPLTEYASRLEQIKKDHKVREYITITSSDTQKQ